MPLRQLFYCNYKYSVWVLVCVTEPQTLIEVIRNKFIPEIQRLSMRDYLFGNLLQKYVSHICFFFLPKFGSVLRGCVFLACKSRETDYFANQ